MNYLLDTHTFIWTFADSKKLSSNASKAIKSSSNDIYLSAVSLWEIAIKSRIGKIDLGEIKVEELIDIADKMEIVLIGLSPEESCTYCNLLEPDHRDPFDRMLIWQAITRKYVIISKDEEFYNFCDYGLKILW